jgi:hypothetical protein
MPCGVGKRSVCFTSAIRGPLIIKYTQCRRGKNDWEGLKDAEPGASADGVACLLHARMQWTRHVRRLPLVAAFRRDAPIARGADVAMARTHPGSEDMPIIPGTRFRVHDSARPQPRIVHPGTASTQENPGEPPSDAVILFDGVELSRWVSVKGGEANWRVEQGYMEVGSVSKVEMAIFTLLVQRHIG